MVVDVVSIIASSSFLSLILLPINEIEFISACQYSLVESVLGFKIENFSHFSFSSHFLKNLSSWFPKDTKDFNLSVFN